MCVFICGHVCMMKKTNKHPVLSGTTKMDFCNEGTALKLIAGSWNPSSFSPAACVQTSSFWNTGKWCTKMASCSSAVLKPYKGSAGPNSLLWHQEDGSLDHSPVCCSRLRVFRSFHRLHLCAPALVIVGLWMAALNTRLCDAHTVQCRLTPWHQLGWRVD